MATETKHIRQKTDALLKTTEDMDPQIRLFIGFYIQTMNSAQAARLAGYSSKSGGDNVIGFKLLHRPEVKEAIENHLREIYMPIVEMKARMTEHARGSFESITDIGDDGSIKLNWVKARDNGGIRLVKKMRMTERFIPGEEGKPPTREVKTEVEIHDPQNALIQIGKIEGLYKEHVIIDPIENEGTHEAMTRAYLAGKALDEKKKAHGRNRPAK